MNIWTRARWDVKVGDVVYFVMSRPDSAELREVLEIKTAEDLSEYIDLDTWRLCVRARGRVARFGAVSHGIGRKEMWHAEVEVACEYWDFKRNGWVATEWTKEDRVEGDARKPKQIYAA